MAFTEPQSRMLAEKLEPKNVKGRTQGSAKVQYIEGWHAIAEANRIFGFDGWSRETVSCVEVCRYEIEIGERKTPGWKVGYEAKVRVVAGNQGREGTGHGSGIARDLFDAIESAAKEAETDAMKRALMTFGNPFGLALYDKSRVNVGHNEPPASEGGGTPFDDPQPDAAQSAESYAEIKLAVEALTTAAGYYKLLNLAGYQTLIADLTEAHRIKVDGLLATSREKLGIKGDSNLRQAG